MKMKNYFKFKNHFPKCFFSSFTTNSFDQFLSINKYKNTSNSIKLDYSNHLIGRLKTLEGVFQIKQNKFFFLMAIKIKKKGKKN